MFLELRECKARSNSVSEGSKYLLTPTSYDVSVKSINCVCARTNKQFILIDTPNTENEIKWCEHAILWEFEVFEDCGNCIAMEQSGYISEWQNLLLTLTSLNFSCLIEFGWFALGSIHLKVRWELLPQCQQSAALGGMKIRQKSLSQMQQLKTGQYYGGSCFTG